MSEIYWLQRVGALSNLFLVILILSFIVFGISLFIYIVSVNDFKNVAKRVIKFTKISFVTLVIGTLGNVFIPTTKEMYAIYGIGGVIDYIQSNDKAKQLPDKCINALTRYVDSIEEENNNEKK